MTCAIVLRMNLIRKCLLKTPRNKIIKNAVKFTAFFYTDLLPQI